jgi:hypothetical protein
MSEVHAQGFDAGWTADVSASRQPSNTVRGLRNMRTVTNTNNDSSVESILGTLKTANLNPGYFPIGWARHGNKIAVLSTRDLSGTDKNGEIGVLTVNPETLIGTYTPLYNHVDLTFNSAHQVEAVLYDETESVQRLYWTDFYNSFRALNILDSRVTTHIVAGSLMPGQEYMCVRSLVTNGSGAYGPNAVAGTVFIADGTEVYGAGALVREYVNVSLLDVVPKRDGGNIVFNRWLTGGNLTGGSYQYAYQLYTSDGISTNFSYLSQPFHSPNNVAPSVSTVDYQKLQGQSLASSTQKGIRIEISGIDTNFDKIKVVAVRTTAFNAVDPPKVIYDGTISGAVMFFDHNGNEQLGELSLADLNAAVLAIDRVRTLSVLKNKMFIGNVKLAPFIEFDRTGVTAQSIDYLFPTDTVGRPDATSVDNTAGITGHTYVPATGIVTIHTNQWYEVLTGTVTYNATAYSAGSTFKGVATVHSYSGTGTIRAVIKIQKYTGAYKLIPILDDYMDMKSAAVATHLRSLWSGETYRYGIVFCDKFGNPQFVYWLMDWQVPNQYDTTDPSTGNALTFSPVLSEEIANDYGTGNHGTSLRSLGVKFSGIDFNYIATKLGVTLADLDRYIGGWYIVRAKRDAQVLAQGILAPTVVDGTQTRPLSTTVLASDKYGAANGRRGKVYNFFSPEFLFQYNNLPNVQNGDRLKVQDYLNDNFKATTEGTLHTNNFHYYEKFYTSVNAPAGYPAKGSTNELDNTKCFNIAIGASGIIYDTGFTFENRSASAGFVWGAERECTGSFTHLMYTKASEPGTWPNGFAAVNTNRSLVNFVRPKGNLYGGTSDAAKAATVYEYCGHYQPMDSAFMAYLQGSGGIANDVEVFGGDAFVGVFDIARMMKDESNLNIQAGLHMVFPVQSSINVALRQGRHFTKDRSFDSTQPLINTNGICYANPPQPEQFIYNTAYSYEESFISFVALPVGFSPSRWFKRRVYASLTKTDGELTDSFRKFPINDYLDLEGMNGELTNLRTKQSRLFYWQHEACGNLPVFERQLSSGSLGEPTTIGVGGVLERNDDIQNYYGNQHQFGLGETESGFFWYDAQKKEMLSMNVGTGLSSISVIEGLRTFFRAIQGESLSGDNPVRNRGIAAAYNPSVKQMCLVFRGVLDDDIGEARNPLSPTGFMVEYNNLKRHFTGNHDLLPGLMIEYGDMLLMSYSGAYDAIQPSFSYAAGERVNDGTDIYVCVLSFTTPGVPVAPSLDSTHWVFVCSINEIHIADKGDVCKFFGLVYDNSLSVISNPNPLKDKVFDNFEMEAGTFFFSSARYSDSQDAVSESMTGDNYRRINKTWCFSVPFLASGDRFRDRFMGLRFTKDNKLNGSPVTSSNQQIKAVSLLTFYRITY